MRPSQLRWRDWKAIFLRIYDCIWQDNLFLIAAGVAFYAMLALFPAIAALVALYGLVADPADISEQLHAAEDLLPPDAYSIIEKQVNDLTTAQSQTLTLASAVATALALWSARLGVNAMMMGLNVVYKEPTERSFLSGLLVTMALTGALLVVVIITLVAIIVVPAALEVLNVDTTTAWVAWLLRWPIVAAAVMFGIGILYRYAPERRAARARWITVGSVVATLLWLLGSLLFSYYVAGFANYNEMYGSLGAIIGLLMWFWLSAFIVLLGAELNSEMEHHTRRDTTVGKPKPMGRRGAYVADHVPGDRD